MSGKEWAWVAVIVVVTLFGRWQVERLLLSMKMVRDEVRDLRLTMAYSLSRRGEDNGRAVQDIIETVEAIERRLQR